MRVLAALKRLFTGTAAAPPSESPAAMEPTQLDKEYEAAKKRHDKEFREANDTIDHVEVELTGVSVELDGLVTRIRARQRRNKKLIERSHPPTA